MMKIYQFFRLIRFTNLLVIALSMTVVEMFLLNYKMPIFDNLVFNDYSVYEGLGNQAHQISGFYLNELKFFSLLILSHEYFLLRMVDSFENKLVKSFVFYFHPFELWVWKFIEAFDDQKVIFL